MSINITVSEEGFSVLLDLVVRERNQVASRSRQLDELYNTLSNHINQSPSNRRAAPSKASLYLSPNRCPLFAPPIEYSPSDLKPYRSIMLYEDPGSDTAVIRYSSSTYFVSIAAVKNIPYPFPPDFFKPFNLSTSRVTAVRMYRRYLAEYPPADDQPLIDPDDGYKPILKTDTRVPSEDFTKIEGTLEE